MRRRLDADDRKSDHRTTMPDSSAGTVTTCARW
jgi:hypothetical protein